MLVKWKYKNSIYIVSKVMFKIYDYSLDYVY